MKRNIIQTADGSTTIQIEDWHEQYHSMHGAVNEAYHVFINAGLSLFYKKAITPISILEIGFGTGLNAFITYIEASKAQKQIAYTAIEAYPVSKQEVEQLNYPQALNSQDMSCIFDQMHTSAWEQDITLSDTFMLYKRKQFFKDITDKNKYHLIYFDAFGAQVQPELWTQDIFQKMYDALLPQGVLVTYCAKGSVRRAMQAVGFLVERLPGPPMKREMLRATKNI